MSTHRRTGAVTRLLLAALDGRPLMVREISDLTGISQLSASRALRHLSDRGVVAGEPVPGAVGRGMRWCIRKAEGCPRYTDPRATIARLEAGPATTTALSVGDARPQHSVLRQLATCEALGWVAADRSRKPHRWSLTDAGRRAVRAWRRDEADIADARRPRR